MPSLIAPVVAGKRAQAEARRLAWSDRQAVRRPGLRRDGQLQARVRLDDRGVCGGDRLAAALALLRARTARRR